MIGSLIYYTYGKTIVHCYILIEIPRTTPHLLGIVKDIGNDRRKTTRSPDAAARSVVVEYSETVTPHNVGSGTGNFTDDALELNRAASLVDLLLDHPPVVVHHLHARH